MTLAEFEEACRHYGIERVELEVTRSKASAMAHFKDGTTIGTFGELTIELALSTIVTRIRERS